MINLFYPSSLLPHKNHHALLKKDLNVCLADLNIKLFLTINPPCSKHFSNIICLGRISKSDCSSHLLNSTALLWVSSIESFGLPLFEAAKFDKPIIALDMPYITSIFNDGIYKIRDLSSHQICETLHHFSTEYHNSSLMKPSLRYSFNHPSIFLQKFHNALNEN